MAQFNERRAASGAIGGAAAGASAGPWGAAAGAVAGGLLGGFGGSSQQGINQERLDMMLSRRLGQIQQFTARMTANRQRLLDRTQALQNLAYTRFAANLEAQFASRGKQVTGGAYQSGLGREAAMKQAELTQYEADLARQDEISAQNYTNSAYDSWMNKSTDMGNTLAGQEYREEQASGAVIGQAIPILAAGAGSSLQKLFARRRAQLQPNTVSFGNSSAFANNNQGIV